MFSRTRPALVAFFVLTLLTGVAYPFAVTLVSKIAFREQATGSLVVQNAEVRGSKLLGQSFEDAKYFWGRPSATAPFPYNTSGSQGSNLAQTNPLLLESVNARLAKLRAADPENKEPVPIDLVTASASGLDPHISPAAARFQEARVAKARGRSPAEIDEIVRRCIESPTFGTLGEPRVNVVLLNMALDALR